MFEVLIFPVYSVSSHLWSWGEAWEPGNAGENGVESIRKAGKKRESIA